MAAEEEKNQLNLGFQYSLSYHLDDLPDLDEPVEETKILHNFGQMSAPVEEEWGGPIQLVRVWNLPTSYQPQDVFSWLGETFEIHKRSKKFLILKMNSGIAGDLVKTKNSKVFGGQFVGLRFEDPAEEKIRQKKIKSVETKSKQPIQNIPFEIIEETDLKFEKISNKTTAEKLKNEEESMNIKGMPRVGKIALEINGKQTEIIIQIFPDSLFIIITQLKKIAHMIHFNQPETNMITMKKMKPNVRVSLGVQDQFSEFLGRQIYKKYCELEQRRTRNMTFATGFPKNISIDIATTILKSVEKMLNSLL